MHHPAHHRWGICEQLTWSCTPPWHFCCGIPSFPLQSTPQRGRFQVGNDCCTDVQSLQMWVEHLQNYMKVLTHAQRRPSLILDTHRPLPCCMCALPARDTTWFAGSRPAVDAPRQPRAEYSERDQRAAEQNGCLPDDRSSAGDMRHKPLYSGMSSHFGTARMP